jgi:hypothetical protein
VRRGWAEADLDDGEEDEEAEDDCGWVTCVRERPQAGK